MRSAYRFRKLFSYVRHFGLLYGIRNFLNASRKDGVVRLTPGVGSPPLLARAGTSDIDVFDEVFVRRAYLTERLSTARVATVVDAGANIGVTSVFLARCFPDARVIAIEPEQQNYDLLVRNITPYPQITALRAAVWDRDGMVHVEDPGRGAWSFTVTSKTDATGQQVPAVTMNTVCNRFGLSRIDLVKMDIEGAEQRVFSGDLEWLKSTTRVVIELHDRFVDGCSQAFYSAIAPFAFRQDIRDKNVFVELAERGRAHRRETENGSREAAREHAAAI